MNPIRPMSTESLFEDGRTKRERLLGARWLDTALVRLLRPLRPHQSAVEPAHSIAPAAFRVSSSFQTGSRKADRLSSRSPLTRPSATLSPSDGERAGVRGFFLWLQPSRAGGIVPALALIFCLFVHAGRLHAADPLTETFQKGLFEEEANRDLAAAVKAYEEVVRQLDGQRKLAATAVFRLGECYRKLGRTNDAVAQFQRVVREFSGEDILMNLSRQNLAGLGAGEKEVARPTSGRDEKLREEAAALKKWRQAILSTSEEDLESLIGVINEDPMFSSFKASGEMVGMLRARLRGLHLELEHLSRLPTEPKFDERKSTITNELAKLTKICERAFQELVTQLETRERGVLRLLSTGSETPNRSYSIQLLEQQIKELKEASGDDAAALALTLFNDPEIASVQSALATQQLAYPALSEDKDPDHPDVQRHKILIAALKATLATQVAALIESQESRLRALKKAEEFVHGSGQHSNLALDVEETPAFAAALLESQLEEIKNTQTRYVPNLILGMFRDPTLGALARARGAAQSDYFDKISEVSKDHPEARKLEATLGAIEAKIEEYVPVAIRAKEAQLRALKNSLRQDHLPLPKAVGDIAAQRAALEREIELAQQQLKIAQTQVSVGRATAEETLKAEREVLRLQRELAALPASNSSPAQVSTAASGVESASAVEAQIAWLKGLDAQDRLLAIQTQVPSDRMKRLMEASGALRDRRPTLDTKDRNAVEAFDGEQTRLHDEITREGMAILRSLELKAESLRAQEKKSRF